MIILGINAYFCDSSACIVIDGKLICAISEERIRRVKHWGGGFPTESLRWCLNYTGVNIKEVDYIAISRNPYSHLLKRTLRMLKEISSFGFLLDKLRGARKFESIKSIIANTLKVDLSTIKAELINVEHHKAHIASAFLVSPFDKSACVSIDGSGDFLSVMRAVGKGNKIEVLDWVEFPHSLGSFYTTFTQFLGFKNFGDEYKVMGLSALGEPSCVDKMRKVIKIKNNGLFELDSSFFLEGGNEAEIIWKNGEIKLRKMFSDKTVEVFGQPRKTGEEITKPHKDIAASMQTVYEETFVHMLNDIYQKTGIDKLTLAGGCIQNSVANGKVFGRTPFKDAYIPPATGDEGTAVGATFWVWNKLLGNERAFVMSSPYWGPEFSDAEIVKDLKRSNLKYRIMNEEEIITRTAQDIACGKIVGWFQGRSEWGPRALGNRSIIADPRKSHIKDVLNRRIKRREDFRPFAPSILEEFVSEWFEESRPVSFMEKVYKVKTQKIKYIPAVVHVDGTARVQTVSKSLNPRYYVLIEEFYRQTNVPMVLNTSFNENEPIVNHPADAINCFLRTKMDVFVISNYYVSK